MYLFDVNIYIYAHREDTQYHKAAKRFLESALSKEKRVGFTPLALSGFIRVVTHPKIFAIPSDLDTAAAFCESVVESPASVPIFPGRSSWAIFTHLIGSTQVKGNLVPGAWYAAIAIEHGCTWMTTDRDYSRFPGLKVEYPLMS